MKTSYFPPDKFSSALQEWGIWVVLSAAGLGITYPLAATLSSWLPSSTSVPRIVLDAVLVGTPFGFAQWIFLRSLPPLRLWTFATAATYPLIGFAFLLFALAHNIPSGADPQFAHRATATVAVSVLFAPVGLLQWLLLRRVFRRAGLWIPITYGSWLLAFIFLFFVLKLSVQTPSALLPPTSWGVGLIFSIIGGIHGAVTGVVLLSLKLRSPLHPSGA